MKKFLIYLIASVLLFALILPLASCSGSCTGEYESDSESEDASESISADSSESSEPDPNESECDGSTAESSDTFESISADSSESDSDEPWCDESDSDEPDSSESTSTEISYVEKLPTGDGYTWKDAVENLSGNWNPHTFQTEDEKYPLNYITAGLYAFFYNDKGENGLDPFKGYVAVPEMAAEMPIDITETVKAEHPEFGIPVNATEGYAYKIALNKYATWQNGEKITADTYIYSMAQLLDPELQNYRADEYLWIANSEAYLRQGTTKYIKSTFAEKYTVADLQKREDGVYVNPLSGNTIYIAIDIDIDYFSYRSTLADYVNAYGDIYFSMTYWEELNKVKNAEGAVALTDETYAMILDLITGNDNWGEDESYLYNYFVEGIDFKSDYSFSNVGLYKTDEYEIVIVFEKPLQGFELISKLTDSWLVYEPYYEAGKVVVNGRLINKYGTSLSTTMSHGPYKMTSHLRGSFMTFEQNEGWYGYTDGKHTYIDPKNGKTYDMYQTTDIICQQASKAEIRNMFFGGAAMSYILGSDDISEYRDSDNAYFTPSDAVYFLILNGYFERIQEREKGVDFDTTKYDIETLTLESFRQAISLTYGKEEFASSISPSRIGTLGLIGSAYVYDPETGTKYRDTDEAKRVLCEYYGVDTINFESLDAAVDSITGCDPELAKFLFTKAFNEAIEAGYITDSDGDGISDQTVKLQFASAATSSFMKASLIHLNGKLAEMTVGTPFEGRIEIKESAPYGSGWVEPIMKRMDDIILSGWSGDLLNPYSLTENYTDPQKQYDDKWFDSSAVSLTLNIEGNEITMSLREWSQALNGTTVEFTEGFEMFFYNFADADANVKLQILAAIEGEILKASNYVPLLEDGAFTLLSSQVEYVVDEYNPVMGRGEIAYIRYNCNDIHWAAYVAAQGGKLEY